MKTDIYMYMYMNRYIREQHKHHTPVFHFLPCPPVCSKPVTGWGPYIAVCRLEPKFFNEVLAYHGTKKCGERQRVRDKE